MMAGQSSAPSSNPSACFRTIGKSPLANQQKDLLRTMLEWASWKDGSGVIVPVSIIAERMSLSPRRVQQISRSLESIGIVTVEKRYRNGRETTSMRCIDFAAIERLSFQAGRGTAPGEGEAHCTPKSDPGQTAEESIAPLRGEAHCTPGVKLASPPGVKPIAPPGVKPASPSGVKLASPRNFQKNNQQEHGSPAAAGFKFEGQRKDLRIDLVEVGITNPTLGELLRGPLTREAGRRVIASWRSSGKGVGALVLELRAEAERGAIVAKEAAALQAFQRLAPERQESLCELFRRAEGPGWAHVESAQIARGPRVFRRWLLNRQPAELIAS